MIQYGEYAFINPFKPDAEHQIFPNVDLDHATKTYHPWACESTLETLQIKIAGILWHGDEDSRDKDDEDTYPLQRLVYRHLARLTS